MNYSTIRLQSDDFPNNSRRLEVSCDTFYIFTLKKVKLWTRNMYWHYFAISHANVFIFTLLHKQLSYILPQLTVIIGSDHISMFAFLHFYAQTTVKLYSWILHKHYRVKLHVNVNSFTLLHKKYKTIILNDGLALFSHLTRKCFQFLHFYENNY